MIYTATILTLALSIIFGLVEGDHSIRSKYSVSSKGFKGEAAVSQTASAIARLLSDRQSPYDNEEMHNFEASPDCPCVNPWPSPTAIEIAANCRNVTWSDSTTSCVPLNYGASFCEYWDKNFTRPGSFCDEDSCVTGDDSYSWCFVDKSNCARPMNPFDDFSFHQSYATCGNVGEYGEYSKRKFMKGLKLRMSFPGDSSDGYNILTRNGEKAGATMDFIKNLRDTYGFTWELKEVSNKSKVRYSSSYTACVHEVALNETDICIGPFWTTNERLLLTTFTTTLFNDLFYLVSRKAEDVTFLDLMSTPFVPFMPQAWFVLGGVVLYMALAVSLIQEKRDKRNKKYLNGGRIARRTGNSVFYAVTSFAKGEVTSESDEPNVAEKIVIAGFMVFALIVLTAYTASSAAALVNTGGGGTYETIQDVLKNDAKICIEGAISNQFLNIYQQTEHLIVEKTKAAELVTGMDTGECTVAVMKEDAINYINANEETHCNKVQAGSVLLTLANSFPINKNYQEAFVYAVGKSVNDGDFKSLRSINQAKYVGESLCGGVGGGGSDGGIERLSTSHLLAPILLTFVCTTIGLIVAFYNPKKICESARKTLSSPLQHFSRANKQSQRKKTLSINRTDSDEDDDRFSDTHLNNHHHQIITDEDLRTKIEGYSANKVIKYLQRGNVDRDQINEAALRLPDKSELNELLFYRLCSRQRRIQHLLCTALNVVELIEIANSLKMHRIDVDQCMEKADTSDEVMENIVKEISSSSVALREAGHKMEEMKNIKIDHEEEDEEMILNKSNISENHFPRVQTSTTIDESTANGSGAGNPRKSAMSYDSMPLTKSTSASYSRNHKSTMMASGYNNSLHTKSREEITRPLGRNINIQSDMEVRSNDYKIKSSSSFSSRVFLSGHDSFARSVSGVFLGMFPNSIKEMTYGFMTPLNGVVRNVSVIHIQLSNPSEHYDELIKFYLLSHDPTVEKLYIFTCLSQELRTQKIIAQLQRKLDLHQLSFKKSTILTEVLEVGPFHEANKVIFDEKTSYNKFAGGGGRGYEVVETGGVQSDFFKSRSAAI